jgi:phosphoserine aminotransferase
MSSGVPTTSTRRPFNLSAGPSILPEPVFELAAAACGSLRALVERAPGSGTAAAVAATGSAELDHSILEVSHRGPVFTAVIERAQALCHDVLGVPRSHVPLLLHGGASLQFAAVPLNLGARGAGADGPLPAAYVDTGVWADKAIAQARAYVPVRVVASSKASGYDRVPELDPATWSGCSYLHATTNNTIYGTEFADVPDGAGVPVVIDASSHIGSRPLALERAAVIYAGAQKNLGPAGVALVAVREDLLRAPALPGAPLLLRWGTHADPPSLYHTPNTFGVLVLALVLEWIEGCGGLTAMAAHNAAKAERLYAALDASALYRAKAQPGSRSRMNVVWTLAGAGADEPRLTAGLLARAEAAGFVGLKGHRSAGGLRASMYNAFPRDGVDALVELLEAFERAPGG